MMIDPEPKAGYCPECRPLIRPVRPHPAPSGAFHGGPARHREGFAVAVASRHPFALPLARFHRSQAPPCRSLLDVPSFRFPVDTAGNDFEMALLSHHPSAVK